MTGAERSSYWPAGTAAFHVAADIADVVIRYVEASGDADFERKIGLDLLAQAARLWHSLGHHDAQGGFRIDGVTGPDEYSAITDNIIFTNLMAQHNLRSAVEASERNPDRARQLGIGVEEMAAWHDAAEAMVIPYDATLGVHPQSEGFTGHQVWDSASTIAEQYPLLLHFPYFNLHRKQVVKQADFVLAMHLRGEAFTQEQKAANFGYDERLTVRDSSLFACTQVVIAAEVGRLQLAHDYLAEAALMDLDSLEHNTADGLHVAALAQTWIAVVAGLGCMRERNGLAELRPSFAPRLPDGLTRVAFCVVFQGRQLRVETTHEATSYQLTQGDPLQLFHFGEATVVSGKGRVVPPTPQDNGATPATPPPTQPEGRKPVRRRPTPATTPARRATP